MKVNKSAKAVIAVFVVIHALIIADFVISRMGVGTYVINSFVVSSLPYIIITFVQIVLSMIKTEDYNIVQVGLLFALAGVKAFITIGLEIAFEFNSAYNFAGNGLPLAAAGFIGLCGLLCLAEIIVPIAVLIINNKKLKVAE